MKAICVALRPLGGMRTSLPSTNSYRQPSSGRASNASSVIKPVCGTISAHGASASAERARASAMLPSLLSVLSAMPTCVARNRASGADGRTVAALTGVRMRVEAVGVLAPLTNHRARHAGKPSFNACRRAWFPVTVFRPAQCGPRLLRREQKNPLFVRTSRRPAEPLAGSDCPW